MKLSSIPRALAERMTRNWVYRRRLPPEFGGARIFVSASAGLKFLFRPMAKTDPSLFRNAIELVRPGDIVWDIGANIGLFTFSAAARAGNKGQVVSFEPDTWLVQVLRRSAYGQPEFSSPVHIISTAVAAEVGLRQFKIASRSRASNALAVYGGSQMGGTSEEHLVVTLSLNWLADRLPQPNVIKCDVEGAELEVFDGQAKIFNVIRPVIICEIGQKAAERMTAILTKGDYRLFDGDKPLNHAAETNKATWNTIGIPAEHYSRYVTN